MIRKIRDLLPEPAQTELAKIMHCLDDDGQAFKQKDDVV